MIRHNLDRSDGSTVAFTVFPGRQNAQAPLLIFIPGWLCTAESWEATAKRLSDRYQTVTVDLPGFGRSMPVERHDWSFGHYGSDIVAVIEAIGANKAVLVGHSMGGAVAVETAIAAPERVAHVIAVDSLIHSAFYDLTPEDGIEPVVAAFADDFANAVSTAMQAYVLPESSTETHTAVETMSNADPARGLAVLREFLRWDVERSLTLLTSPLSLMVAEAFIDDAVRDRWQGRYSFVPIENTGHFIMLDQPEEFDQKLAAILA